ncbi:MAG: Sll0314/Alr1548 family TPR repeat-containing protein [Cyanobacteriota bacterium]|nr:Sll0314/Alr1548 family TPR repeat-containing protein [Cyanobacteriota bacterium]
MKKTLSLLYDRLSILKRLSVIASATAIGLSLSVSPATGDPFRPNNPTAIGDKTEAAFRAMFEEGNYKEAKSYLQQAESQEKNEPLAYAMMASLSYLDEDWDSLKVYASRTREVAEELMATNAVRGNLYAGTGHFLEGAHIITTEGVLAGTPKALNKLKVVLQHFDEAAKQNPNDPELNLLKGYMDLLLAVNLPFANPEDAIEKLERQASPSHLANRGIAIAYRDLKEYDKALEYVNKVLAETPNNPEVYYLKAQILVSQARENNNDLSLREEADKNFEMTLAKSGLMPRRMVAQIFFEQCKNLNNIDSGDRSCDPMRDSIRDGVGTWGPSSVPQL